MKSGFKATRAERRFSVNFAAAFCGIFSLVLYLAGGSWPSSAQTTVLAGPSSLRIGEKLTYSISFGKIANAGFAETHVVSRGKIAGKDAVEIRGRVKTVDLVSAAFLLLDESRTVFAAPDSGLPLYLTTSSLDSVSPKPVVRNYLQQPTLNFDLVTLLFKTREMGGAGNFSVAEGEQVYSVTLQTVPAGERVRTEAGEFDTLVSTVQSDLLTSYGVKEFRINFSADDARVPVLVRMKMPRGEVRASLTAVSLPEPEVAVVAATPTPTPKPVAVVKPTPAIAEYVENQPLAPELGFAIGEVLDYRITSAGKPAGVISFNARERKLISKTDTLVLAMTVTGVEPGTNTLRTGDSARAFVDPDTLTPNRIEANILSPFPGLNQTATFDKRTGAIGFGGKAPLEAPIGTHSFLSLFYAVRSFNLKVSDNRSAPVNDTRVAVFWDGKWSVFTLRPAKPAELTLNGEKFSAQAISISTGIKEIDALSPKVWLRTEDRVPLRFSVGTLQGDLIVTAVPPIL